MAPKTSATAVGTAGRWAYEFTQDQSKLMSDNIQAFKEEVGMNTHP